MKIGALFSGPTRAMLLGLAILVGTHVLVNAHQEPQPKTQWDGVYTEKQAKRGEDIYGAQCTTCHGGDLAGADSAPELAGLTFASNWNDLKLSELADRIRTSMPQNNPGNLSRQETADVVAFILSKNKAPAAETELPPASESLATITFKALKP